MAPVVILLILLGIVLGVVWVIQRSMKRTEATEGGGADLVAYLLLALAMGVTGFAFASLVDTAFPGNQLVFDAAEEVATSLASLVVAAPFVVFLWRRQADRRTRFPASAGWSIYLAIIEIVFVTALVVSAVLFVNGLLTDAPATAWPGVIVFGVIVAFHELAARRDPPLSDAGELQRVIGSAIGLITGGVGLIGCLAVIFGQFFETFDLTADPFVAMLIVGVPVWAYRWLRPWPSEPAAPRLTWVVVVTTASLTATIGAVTWMVAMVLQYLLTDTPPAADHFEGIPVAAAIAITSVPVWLIHRRDLGAERTNPVRAHHYLMAAMGLVTAVTAAIGLTIIGLDRSLIVGGAADDIVATATVLIAGLATWRVFTPGPVVAQSAEERLSWPSRVFHLGLGVVFGLAAAGSLITALFILLQRLLGEDIETSSLLAPITILIYTGLATWYLLAGHARARQIAESSEAVKPFEVTIITSHPGMLAARFPEEARLHVIYRGDEAGKIDDEMADAIVAAVANRPSIVWVDQDGFRVAPKAARS